MRRFTLTLLTFIALGGGLFAQSLKPMTEKQKVSVQNNEWLINKAENLIPSAKSIAPTRTVPPSATAGKTAALSPVTLGRASNAFTILRTQQDQVVANTDLDMVVFIHRHDVTFWGGGTTENGKYRYDISIDAGATFANDIGPVQTTYTNYGRYPIVTSYNPDKSINPFDQKLIWGGATNKFPTPGWLGHVYGTAETATSNPITSTENYVFDDKNTLIPGGIATGMEGEFWTVGYAYDNSADVMLDSLNLYKGVWDTAASYVIWDLDTQIYIPSYRGYDGNDHHLAPNIAFSQNNPMIGYAAWCGDMDGGNDTVYSPIFTKTTDGGMTWSTPVEMDLNVYPVLDSLLTTFWAADSTGTTPAGNGKPTTAFNFDITVDSLDRLHLFTTICNSAYTFDDGDTPDDERLPTYSVLSGLEMYAVDFIIENDTTMTPVVVSPVLTLRWDNGFDPADDEYLSMDNYCQVSRTPDGSRIFYSWLDSDGVYTNCSEAGGNDFPDLRGAALRISDGMQIERKKISDDDLVYGGNILHATVSPTCLLDGSTYNVPTVFMQILTDPLNPVQFYYVGDDNTYMESEFADPATFTSMVYGAGFCDTTTIISVDPQINGGNVVEYKAFPNPANLEVKVNFELNKATDLEVNVVNMFGQVVKTAAADRFTVGSHELSISTSDIAPGIYFFNLKSGEQSYSEKIVIIR